MNPVKWTTSVERTCDGEAVLVFKAKIDESWHLYSQIATPDGPVATSFKFTAAGNYKADGKTIESKPITKKEPVFDNAELRFFEGKAEFRQKIKILSKQKFSVKAAVEYMTCNDKQCLPPDTKEFELAIDAAPGKPCETKDKVQNSGVTPCECDSQNIYKLMAAKKDSAAKTKKDTSSAKTAQTTPVKTGTAQAKGNDPCSFWSNFFKGILAGFGALIAPCIYAMLPLTVSFFLKQSKTRSQGIRKALIYGFFIVIIFDIFGLAIVIPLGPEAPNLIASNVLINVFLFLLFFIFGASFLGAFEITLPSSWVNKADAASERGGIIGIFFMAFTLALVSFSCTVPFIGALLTAISYGNYLCPIAGFTGFGLAIALPFTIAAVIPSLLKTMPKSGGWLNAVKVSLGLIEIALALKFLSNADLVAKWHLLSRETFIALWIACAGILGIYLLGKLKFHHDSDVPYLSVTRTMFAILALAFSLYMIPGLFGARLNLIGAFPPPQDDEWSENMGIFGSSGTTVLTDTSHAKGSTHKNTCPRGINDCFHNYSEALAYARKAKKPLMIDFTGWTCVNCRKMEQNVWPKKQVNEIINNEYVLVSLYVDDRTELPKDSQYVSKATGKNIVTTGNKWTELESTRYKINSQPYYVLLDNNEKLLNDPRGYTPDVDEYAKFLQDGVNEFKKRTGK